MVEVNFCQYPEWSDVADGVIQHPIKFPSPNRCGKIKGRTDVSQCPECRRKRKLL